MLYIVATPIGNLKDITYRAVEVLKSADIVLAEDTRRTRLLFDRHQIETSKLVSFHEHSSDSKISWILEQLKQGKEVALVTDAGTPGVSDPGGKLISCIAPTSGRGPDRSVGITPIPGPSALATILSVLSWPTEPVLYLGYLPKKKGRQTLLAQLAQDAQIAQTVVFFESPYRIIQTLKDLQKFLGDHQIVVGREMTKQFEDIYYGTFKGALEHFKDSQKGEFTIAFRERG